MATGAADDTTQKLAAGGLSVGQGLRKVGAHALAQRDNDIAVRGVHDQADTLPAGLHASQLPELDVVGLFS